MITRLTLGFFPLALVLVLAAIGARAQSGEFVPGRIFFQTPPQWSAEGKKAKLTLVSPGEDAFIVLTVLQPGDENLLRAQTAQLLNQYLTDMALADSGQRATIAGMAGLRFKGTGASDATSVRFIAAVVTPERNTPVMLLAYTTQKNFAAAEPVFEEFLRSLKPR
ncbi:MAG: hypothetical protein ABI439_07780 [Rhodospirillales bacterium]